MAAPDPQRNKSLVIMPEHCMGDVFGSAAQIRAACDDFFKRRGLNQYGGLREIIHTAAERGKARKRRRAA